MVPGQREGQAILQVKEARVDKGANWAEQKPGEKNYGQYLLVLMTYGRCVYWVEEEKLILQKGDLLLIPLTAAYYGKSIPATVHSKFVINFRYEGEGSDLALLRQAQYTKTRTARLEWMQDRMEKVVEEWRRREPYYEVLASALLMEILAIWNRECEAGLPASKQHSLLEAMKGYLQNHYRGKVTKEQLGQFIGKSPNYTAVLFRQLSGQTISEYVHAIRMKTALHMLMDSELTVSEIAEFLGYSDPSYFHKIFKSRTGKSPSDFLEERQPKPK